MNPYQKQVEKIKALTDSINKKAKHFAETTGNPNMTDLSYVISELTDLDKFLTLN